MIHSKYLSALNIYNIIHRIEIIMFIVDIILTKPIIFSCIIYSTTQITHNVGYVRVV